MKSFLLAFALLTVSSVSFAKTVLNCTTPGDALNDVQVVSGNPGKIVVSYLDDSSETYFLSASTKNIEKGDSDTLVAAKDFNNAFGGGVADAVLLRVLPGQTDARLAANGAVYYLKCSK